MLEYKYQFTFVITVIMFAAIIIGIIKYYEILERIEHSQNMEAGIEIADNSSDIIDNQQAIKVLQIQQKLLDKRIKELSNIND